jgi:hypothetical protein
MLYRRARSGWLSGCAGRRLSLRRRLRDLRRYLLRGSIADLPSGNERKQKSKEDALSNPLSTLEHRIGSEDMVCVYSQYRGLPKYDVATHPAS